MLPTYCDLLQSRLQKEEPAFSTGIQRHISQGDNLVQFLYTSMVPCMFSLLNDFPMKVAGWNEGT